jgi:uncharacterized membrane protein YdfJ with MMPL/SSD domain
MGGWSVRHRRSAILGWLLLVVVAAALGSLVGQRQMTTAEYAEGDSAKALSILQQAGLEAPAGEMVLLHSETQTADASAFRDAVGDLLSALQATGQVTDLVEPYGAGLVSADRRGVLVRFAMTGDAETADERVQPVLDAVAAVRGNHPAISVDQFGEASVNKWFNDTILADFHRAEWTAVPLALGILLAAFGALLAAVLPVGLALTAFLAANGILALISRQMPLDSSTSSVMLLIGLAVGVDYCLFYLRRAREERTAGKDAPAALRIAAATSGRAVLVSGMTVVVAMSGMFLSGMMIFDGFAVATVTVVLVAMLGSVTVLPAILSVLGDRVDTGRLPGAARLRRPQGGSRAWGAVLRPVLAHPAVSALAAVAFLLVLAVPAARVHTEKLGLDKLLPADSQVVQSYDRIAAAFPGGASPARVVTRAPDIEAPAVRRALADFTTAAGQTGLVGRPIQVTVHAEEDVAEISVPLAGNGSDGTSRRALEALREDVVPATLAAAPGTETYVTGDLAFSTDFNSQLKRSILPVILFVLGLAFVLMLVAFRSVTIAAVSVLLNLLSMAAAFGVIVAVFQFGWGAGLFGTEGVGAIESWLPLFAFVVLFGLSMDYHVFVVSRIREAHDAGMSTRDAVSHGIRTSAGVVTSAAIIMVAVFGVFATLSMQTFKQLGVGLAVAILLDATIVRAVLLPSVLTLLDDRTWYLPRWLSSRPGSRRTADGPSSGSDGPGPADGRSLPPAGGGPAAEPAGVGHLHAVPGQDLGV